MKRATLVMATSVALFLSGVSIHASAAIRKTVSMPSDSSVVNSGNRATRSGDTLSVPGNDIEGEYIPSSYSSPRGTKLPIKPKYDYSIPRTIKGMSGALRAGNIPAMGMTIGLQYMLDQIGGFIDDNGQPLKKSDGGPVSDPTSYRWTTDQLLPGRYFSTPQDACDAGFATVYSKSNYYEPRATYVAGANKAQCVAKRRFFEGETPLFDIVQAGSHCPAESVYDPSKGSCIASGEPVPLTAADYDLMEAAANAKDSDWLKDRLKEHCEGSLKPQACFESLRDSVSLTGPSELNVPGPTTTTTGPNGTTTSNTNTKITINYGDNWYSYNRATTITKTNPDGSTETTTETDSPEVEEEEKPEEEMPPLGDPYAPYIDKLNDIKNDVATVPGVPSPIGYSSWFSFGGGCTEVSAELPVLGYWSTNYCPYVYSWVRPILAFLFVVFTWHYCRELWSEAVQQARPM